ncbi:hypothetical protein [Croceicoccus naphthovorans]|uniref:Uncharacterized protein n=1 Tax=Croceicoccus naphthovorans TaxID=1348774 RepID=A0A0G3XH22_9SPHN|nr:hypothetical protein [Croceicoccus naphthovorans]AKM10497.1 hypothetical protein AB433_11850 [Croceicoccus naphthovorans]MBB3988683.1 hypothetical protein [Croceicoccus naphthovorans]
MTKTISAILAATLMGSAAIPAQAQTATDPDLQCAAWALVASSQEQDEGKKRGLGFMMSYFMGRYEARTNGKIEAQIKPQAIPTLLGDIETANKACAPRAQDFGQRLGETINGLQPPAPSNAQAGEGR